jgi:hypothetical protein
LSVATFGHQPQSVCFDIPTTESANYPIYNSVEEVTLMFDFNSSLTNHMFAEFRKLTTLDLSNVTDEISQADVIHLLASNHVPLKNLRMNVLELPSGGDYETNYTVVFSQLEVLVLDFQHMVNRDISLSFLDFIDGRLKNLKSLEIEALTYEDIRGCLTLIRSDCPGTIGCCLLRYF